MITHILRELILPPASLLVLFVASWVLHKKKPRWGQALFIFTCTVFYLLSIPLVSMRLARTTESVPPKTVEEIKSFEPQAIVVLGGGTYFNGAEFEGLSVPSKHTLERANYAAFLARRLQLPVITTGGYGDTPQDSEGYVTAEYLKESGLETVFSETESSNTRENARFSRRIAEERGWDKVVVVTQASHAGRAQMNFRAAGFQAEAAPTGFRKRAPWERGVLMVIPSHPHFDESCGALRAHMAYVWDWLRS